MSTGSNVHHFGICILDEAKVNFVILLVLSIIMQAYAQSTNLSASSYYVPEINSKAYLNYGAAVSEVSFGI